MNIKLIIRRYSYFSTIVLATVLIVIFYFFVEVYQDGAESVLDNLKRAAIAIAMITLAASVSFLPKDIYQAKKDKNLCEKLGIDFDEFSLMDEEAKDEIRNRVNN
jgi:predicted permease